MAGRAQRATQQTAIRPERDSSESRALIDEARQTHRDTQRTREATRTRRGTAPIAAV
jgi:hypothetical protein